MTDWVSVRLSAELKARVDEARGDVPLARWVARAVEARLDAEGGSTAPVMPSVPASRAREVVAIARGQVAGGVFCPRCDWTGSDGDSCPEHHRAKRVS